MESGGMGEDDWIEDTINEHTGRKPMNKDEQIKVLVEALTYAKPLVDAMRVPAVSNIVDSALEQHKRMEGGDAK